MTDERQRRWSDHARLHRWRNWYAPPTGHHWLEGEVGSNGAQRSVQAYATKKEAEDASSAECAALGASVRYLGVFRRTPHSVHCETCNDTGYHPADGMSHACPDCSDDGQESET